MLAIRFFGAAALVTACAAPAPDADQNTANDPEQKEWQELFNGRDLNAWTPKIKGFPAGENAFNTFRAEDGLLKVRYDEYDTFGGEFGHLFYNPSEFSYYILQVEYRFVGEQVANGPEWAWRNNGVMYHAQTAEEMGRDQDFPTSMEYQLLGGDGENPRSTANLCSPGTHVVMDGELRKDHCINSDSGTYHGDQWVTAELVVHGSEFAQHIVEGEVVMEYSDLQLDDGTPRTGGAIALQAESHPTDFRAVRLLNLEGCKDEKAANYKSYLVKHNKSMCQY